MCRRLREQARSHRGLRFGQTLRCVTRLCGSEPARESGVSAGIDAECTDAFASRLTPTGVCALVRLCGVSQDFVGVSPLAMAVGQLALMLDVPAPSRASSLHRGLRFGQTLRCVTRLCGSEPARESGVSASIDVGCAYAFASKLAPTGVCALVRLCCVTQDFVGASLLAKAVSQLALMLNVPTPSRASSLPQGSAPWSDFAVCHKTLWE